MKRREHDDQTTLHIGDTRSPDSFSIENGAFLEGAIQTEYRIEMAVEENLNGRLRAIHDTEDTARSGRGLIR